MTVMTKVRGLERSRRHRDKLPDSQVYTDQELVTALRTVSSYLGKENISIGDYREHSSRMGLPSVALIIRRMDGWNAAKERAGLSTTPRPKRWAGQYTVESCVNALQEARLELGDLPSIGHYDVWRGSRFDIPSSATIRSTCGGWTRALETTVATFGE